MIIGTIICIFLGPDWKSHTTNMRHAVWLIWYDSYHMSHLYGSSKIRLFNLTKDIGYSKPATRLKRVWVSIMSHFTKRIQQRPRRPQLLQQQNQLLMIQIALSTVRMEDAFGHMTFWDRRNANVMMTHQSTMQQKNHARRNRWTSVHSHVRTDGASCNIIWWVSSVSKLKCPQDGDIIDFQAWKHAHATMLEQNTIQKQKFAKTEFDKAHFSTIAKLLHRSLYI